MLHSHVWSSFWRKCFNIGTGHKLISNQLVHITETTHLKNSFATCIRRNYSFISSRISVTGLPEVYVSTRPTSLIWRLCLSVASATFPHLHHSVFFGCFKYRSGQDHTVHLLAALMFECYVCNPICGLGSLSFWYHSKYGTECHFFHHPISPSHMTKDDLTLRPESRLIGLLPLSN